MRSWPHARKRDCQPEVPSVRSGRLSARSGNALNSGDIPTAAGPIVLLTRYDDAKSALNRALGLNPRDKESAMWLADAHLRTDDQKTAEATLRRFLAEAGIDLRPEGIAEEGDTATGSTASAKGNRARAFLEAIEAGEPVPARFSLR